MMSLGYWKDVLNTTNTGNNVTIAPTIKKATSNILGSDNFFKLFLPVR